MRRIVQMLAVAMVMVAMMVLTAMPAFAHHGKGGHPSEEPDPGLLPSECEVGEQEGPGNSGDSCLVNL